MINSLHGLRGVMAFLVVIHHFTPHLFSNSVTPGNLHHAVDVFFCLSGYVLTLVYRSLMPFNAVSFTNFAKNRIARIVPLAYLNTIVLYSLYYVISKMHLSINNPMDITVPNLIANLLFLDTNLPWFKAYGAKWSVSNEMAAYFMIFPFTFFVTKLRAKYLFMSWLFIVCLQLGFYDDLQNMGYLFGRCIPNFLIGCIIFFIPRLNNKVTILCGFVGFSLFFLAPDKFNGLFSGLIVLYCLSSSKMVKIALENKIAIFLGDISYSLYLTHGIIYLGVAGLLKKQYLMNTYQYWIFVPIVLTIWLSYISWRWVEIPAKNYLRKIM